MSKQGNNQDRGNRGSNSGHEPISPPKCLYKNSPQVQAVRIEPSSEDHRRDASQERYQSSQLKLSRWLNGITLIAATLSFIALIFLYKSTRAATSQAKTAQQEFVSSQRPWLSAEFHISQPLTLRKGVAYLPGVVAVVSNVGHSVAQTVNVHIHIMQTDTETRHECELSPQTRGIRDINHFGYVVFPSQTTTFGYPAFGSGLHEGKFMLDLIGCVTYKSTTDGQEHHTKMIYRIIGVGLNDGYFTDNSGQIPISLMPKDRGVEAN